MRDKQLAFQEQLELVQAEIDEILKLEAPPTTLYNRQLLGRLQEAAFLCLSHRQLQLALEFFNQILLHLDSKPLRKVRNKLSRAEQRRQEDEKRSLMRHTLNNLGSICQQLGDLRKAMALYHQSNEVMTMAASIAAANSTSSMNLLELSPEESDSNVTLSDKTGRDAQSQVDILTQLNVALGLHATGDFQGASLAAEWVLDQLQIKEQQKQNQQQEEEQVNPRRNDRYVEAEISALSILGSCARHGRDLNDAIEFATKACTKADASTTIVPRALVARCHNNLGIYLFEQRTFPQAMHHFILALRAAQQAQDLSQQAVTKYHMGLTLSELEIGVETQWNPTGHTSCFNAPPDMELLSAKEYLRQAEELGKTLNDPVLCLVAKSCFGEREYNSGDFHTAEAEFSIALFELKELMASLDSGQQRLVGDRERTMAKELALLHGRLQSYLGSTHLIEGKFDLALAAHQSDFDLAIKEQDVYGQLRALRNMALVHNTTSRFELALPLWQQSIQLATSLQNPRELMLAYSGLGLALRECELAEPTDQVRALLARYQAPLEVFLRQRALAIELEDHQQQILAQRCVVSIYEMQESQQQQSQQVESIVTQQQQMEQRLAECDMLVKLCKQFGTLQQLSDSYRVLASALTSQVVRLSKRGRRFVEAVKVLAEKRDNVAALYKKTCADIIDIAQTGENADTSALQEGSNMAAELALAQLLRR